MKQKICKYLKDSPCYSKVSQSLFFEILKHIKNKEDVKFALHSGEQYFLLNQPFCKGLSVDFKYENVIIEFYGDFWHGNPEKYKPSDILHHPNNHVSAEKLWELDKKKVDWLTNKGYNVLVVWESEFTLNPKKTVEKCIEFINNNNKNK